VRSQPSILILLKSFRYLRAVEQRLHESEAVLGILLSVPDPQLQNVISGVNEDPFGKKIIDRVHSGAFGPGGRGRGRSISNGSVGDGGGVAIMGLGMANPTGGGSGVAGGAAAGTAGPWDQSGGI
jgi:hypothetical protein